MAIYVAAALAVAALVAIGAPGVKLNPSWVGTVLWLLLFGGLVRGVWLARRLLIAWSLTAIVALVWWGAPFGEWGIAAFAVLMMVQIIALCAQEYAMQEK
jgi:hypothetical protein